MNLPPSGWYRDPDGTGDDRWFDGEAWSEFRRAAKSEPASAPTSLTKPDTTQPNTLSAPQLDPASTWQSTLASWGQVIDALPQSPTMKIGVFSSTPKGYMARELPGRSLRDIATAWGRPSWWYPEPATGGAICGWSRASTMAVHLTADYACDKIFERASNELDLSWRIRLLGNVLGRPSKHVEQVLGLPKSRSSLVGGSLLQWHEPGYHIALKFDANGFCGGITSQHAARPRRV